MLHLLSCHPGREATLIDEWRRLCPTAPARMLGDGWVEVGPCAKDAVPDGACLAFATQVWPNKQDIEAPSISAWAKSIAQMAIDAVPGHAPWRLQLFGQDYGDCAVNQRRLGLIEAAVWTHLKQKQRRLCKSYVVDARAHLPADAFVVSVAMLSATRAAICVLCPQTQRLWRHTFCRFAGALVPIAEDLRPPARAYRKLREALAHLDIAPSAEQSWVDLGAAPGSWSFDAVEAGARIWAIDRSPLREDLMAAPHLTFVKADAFTYLPEAPVDVLVCDVIAFPERNIDLLERWLQARWCRVFVVTLKFRGEDDYIKVDACKAMLARLADTWSLRQLYHNKNEVTALGFRTDENAER